MVIWGNYNSVKAQQIAIKFKMCTGDGCDSEEEIRNWLKKKYIYILYN